MLEEIKKSLEKGNHPYNFNKQTRDIFDEDGKTVAMHIYHNEDVEIITKSPDWIYYLISEVERLKAIEKAIQEYTGDNTYDGLICWLESVTGYSP